MTLEKLKSNYKQSVITCAWFVSNGYRQLIFGMVDFIPRFLGDEQGITEQGIKVKGRRMYYVRYVTSVEEGYRWYSGAIETGELEMPWDNPSKRIAFRGENETFDMVESAQFPATRYNDTAPFRTKLWGGAQMHHFISHHLSGELERFIVADTAVSRWLEERLLWAIDKHAEYLGSVNFVLPNPYFVRCHVRLNHLDKSEAESVAVQLARNCEDKNLSIYLQVRTLGEYGNVDVRRLPLVDNVLFPASRVVDALGYVVVDETGQVLYRQDYTSFLRQINVSLFCHDPPRPVKSRDGSVQMISPAVRESIQIGDDENVPELKLHGKICNICRSRDNEKQGRDQYFYYRDGGAAEAFLRKIVMSAYESLTIIDPYFSASSLKMFLSILNHGVAVCIVTTADGIKTDCDVVAFQKVVKALDCTDKQIEVIVAGSGQLHDRFMIVDHSEVWMLGSSMKSLGDSLSVIVKLQCGVKVAEHLKDTIAGFNAPTLDDWIKQHGSATQD